ncbi:unnamed protein product [Gordionus sp. m RMFG-2023]
MNRKNSQEDIFGEKYLNSIPNNDNLEDCTLSDSIDRTLLTEEYIYMRDFPNCSTFSSNNNFGINAESSLEEKAIIEELLSLGTEFTKNDIYMAQEDSNDKDNIDCQDLMDLVLTSKSEMYRPSTQSNDEYIPLPTSQWEYGKNAAVTKSQKEFSGTKNGSTKCSTSKVKVRPKIVKTKMGETSSKIRTYPYNLRPRKKIDYIKSERIRERGDTRKKC